MRDSGDGRKLAMAVRSFVREHDCQWDHVAFLDFVAQVRARIEAAGAMSDDKIGLLLETERTRELNRRKRGAARRHFPDDFKRKVVAEYRAGGVTQKALAERYDLSAAQVSRWCRAQGTG